MSPPPPNNPSAYDLPDIARWQTANNNDIFLSGTKHLGRQNGAQRQALSAQGSQTLRQAHPAPQVLTLLPPGLIPSYFARCLTGHTGLPARCVSYMPDMLPPPTPLGTGWSLCLGDTSPQYPGGSLPRLLYVFALMSPLKEACPDCLISHYISPERQSIYFAVLITIKQTMFFY